MRRCDGGQWGVRAIIVAADRRRNDLDGRHHHHHHTELTYDIIDQKQVLQVIQMRQVIQVPYPVPAQIQPPQQRHSLKTLFSSQICTEYRLQYRATLYLADDVVAQNLHDIESRGGNSMKKDRRRGGGVQAPCSCYILLAARWSQCSYCTSNKRI